MKPIKYYEDLKEFIQDLIKEAESREGENTRLFCFIFQNMIEVIDELLIYRQQEQNLILIRNEWDQE